MNATRSSKRMRRVSLVSLFVAALMGLACLVPMLAQTPGPLRPCKGLHDPKTA